MSYTMLIVYASIALGVSFLCSMLEAVLLSISHSQVSIMEKQNPAKGKIWQKLKADDSIKPLTAILTLNTIAHTMGAAGVGAEVQKIYGEDSLTIASIFLTLAVLILSEIIPKTLGSTYYKSLANISGRLLSSLTYLMTPIFIPILWLKKMLPQAEKSVVTRDEFAVLADLGEEEGTLEEDEETVIHNLLKLREVPVEDIMTPRVVMTAFPTSWTIQNVLEDTPILRFSRIPVYETDMDDIKGYVIRSEILMAASKDKWELSISELLKPLLKIKSDSNVDAALDIFLDNKEQIAVVSDEFGGTAGLLTMEDVIETLLGEEIVDELDEVEDMRELALDQSLDSEE
ncbi:MAG: hypothetical protein CMA25_04925 [Euryarchaeota archaeon]|nr:hypothetical protein [Euryarchaeota archaeon]